ncbi:hypothetical protein BDR05DRAFT_777677 [Suillus weaverae]|nr:hypothetical protein BDR05DRAFT_777677 [Suillus weaverae]
MTDADEECAKALKSSYFLHYHSQHRDLYRWLYNFAKNIRILLPQIIVKLARVSFGQFRHDVQNARHRDMVFDHRTLVAYVCLYLTAVHEDGDKVGTITHLFMCLLHGRSAAMNGKRKHRPIGHRTTQKNSFVEIKYNSQYSSKKQSTKRSPTSKLSPTLLRL